MVWSVSNKIIQLQFSFINPDQNKMGMTKTGSIFGPAGPKFDPDQKNHDSPRKVELMHTPSKN